MRGEASWAREPYLFYLYAAREILEISESLTPNSGAISLYNSSHEPLQDPPLRAGQEARGRRADPARRRQARAAQLRRGLRVPPELRFPVPDRRRGARLPPRHRPEDEARDAVR